jgi:hypothetical protein
MDKHIRERININIFYLLLVMIQQIITIATLTGVFISYSLRKLYKPKKYEYPYPEIEITDYEYIELWDDI